MFDNLLVNTVNGAVPPPTVFAQDATPLVQRDSPVPDGGRGADRWPVRPEFPGQGGQDYVLETSTNLSAWTPLWTNMPVYGRLTFTNNDATDPARFYRVRH